MPKQSSKNVSIQGRRGLPWHNHEWLKAELVRLGTIRAVAEAHGINLRTLQDYMSRHKIRAPHRPSEFGRPLKDPASPSRTTLWRRKKRRSALEQLKPGRQNAPQQQPHNRLNQR